MWGVRSQFIQYPTWVFVQHSDIGHDKGHVLAVEEAEEALGAGRRADLKHMVMRAVRVVADVVALQVNHKHGVPVGLGNHQRVARGLQQAPAPGLLQANASNLCFTKRERAGGGRGGGEN